jgi:hypothetical protein
VNEIIKNMALKVWAEQTANELALTSPDQYDENTEAMILELAQYKTLGVEPLSYSINGVHLQKFYNLLVSTILAEVQIAIIDQVGLGLSKSIIEPIFKQYLGEETHDLFFVNKTKML